MITDTIKSKLTNKKVFPRGVHPHDFKEQTRDRAIEAVPWPKEVVIPFQQHIGAPAQPTVKPRQEVKRGEVIGTAGGFVSAPVHASVDGKTGPLTTVLTPVGTRVSAVPVQTAEISQEQLEQDLKDFLQPQGPVKPADLIEPEAIVKAAAEAGLVGMGGATFPTHVKLKVSPERKIDTVVLNGSECEPYLTADDRLMREASGTVVRGLMLAMRAVGAPRGVIAIEDNKPEAIAAMRQAAAGYPSVQVAVCAAKYPMGGERQLIPAVLNRVIPTGGLPLDVGVVVVNVATSLALAHAVDRSRPAITRVLTLTGAVHRPGNYYVAIGTPLSHVIEHAGGLKDDAAEVILGGPMMGVTMPDLSTPVTKGTSGITVLTRDQVVRRQETACIRCGRCVDHCPLKLMPTKISQAVKHRDLELAKAYDLMACCECGCCSYVCPAGIPVVQYIKSGKAAEMRRRAREKAEAAKKA